MLTCKTCATPLTKKPGRGRNPTTCKDCSYEAQKARSRVATLARYHLNPEPRRVYQRAYWATVLAPVVDTITSIASKLNEEELKSYAEWLEFLSGCKGERVNQVAHCYKVDAVLSVTT